MASDYELRSLTLLRRARDTIDRDYASPLDVPTVARLASMSTAHFSRQFKAAYGETPHDYLTLRRVERAMALLRAGSSVTDACLAVGYTSASSFCNRFTAVAGETPSRYRARDHSRVDGMPPCLVRVVSRPVGTRPEVAPAPAAGS